MYIDLYIYMEISLCTDLYIDIKVPLKLHW